MQTIQIQPIWVVLGTTSAIILSAAVAMWRERQRLQIDNAPTKWKFVGSLSTITLFPLKSGYGTELYAAECTKLGLKELPQPGEKLQLRDRFFVVLSEGSGSFKTARQHPSLLLVHVVPNGPNSVVMKARGMTDLHIQLPQNDGKNTMECKMWQEESLQTVDCGDEAAEWFNKLLGLKSPTGVRLGYYLMDQMPQRNADVYPLSRFKPVYPNFSNKDVGVYSDLSGYMLMTESSMDNLKQHLTPELANSVQLKQFRPNFVISGTQAFEEDSWEWVRIGENAVFRNVKPCTRCILTTINPDTLEKNKDMEPLKTLRKYRQLPGKAGKFEEGSPAFGINLGLRLSGTVKIGDPVFIGIS